MRRHALVPDAQERIEVDRLAAIVLGLRVGPVAGIGALERRMLGDRVTQVTEPAFDRLRLAAIGLRPMEGDARSEEHTSELQSLMRISYAVFCLNKKKTQTQNVRPHQPYTSRIEHQ